MATSHAPWDIEAEDEPLFVGAVRLVERDPGHKHPLDYVVAQQLLRGDAERILRAVNNHKALVAALEDLVRRLDEEGYDFSGDVEQARKALAHTPPTRNQDHYGLDDEEMNPPHVSRGNDSEREDVEVGEE